MATSQNFKIVQATKVDIPKLSQISAVAFRTDTHTQLKCLVKREGFDMSPALESWIALPRQRCVVMKAVLPAEEEEDEGECVGWACWAFKGFEEGELKSEVDQMNCAESQKTKHEKDRPEENLPRPSTPTPTMNDLAEHEKALLAIRTSASLSPIQQLGAITNASMTFWQSHLSQSSPPFPAGLTAPKHLILVAINVLPDYQGRGIGSSLIAYGTHIADIHGVYVWVSSSDGGYIPFEKAGFREVGRLVVGLDEFALSTGRADGIDGFKKVKNPGREDGVWGRYVWRYMQRKATGFE